MCGMSFVSMIARDVECELAFEDEREPDPETISETIAPSRNEDGSHDEFVAVTACSSDELAAPCRNDDQKSSCGPACAYAELWYTRFESESEFEAS